MSTLSAANSSGPIVISSGGTYSGQWTSTDRNTPAVTITTNDAVVLKNSVVSGPGTLIKITGSGAGANVTIQNVDGTALDPPSAGQQRGNFLNATGVATLSVTHCKMTGVSFGVYLANSTVQQLAITNNMASNLEDRASDGAGGFTTVRPVLGHFVQLNAVTAPNGAEIAWNQVIDEPGSASVEDVISIFNSAGGSADAPIAIHDNYLQGAFSPGSTSYTGGGIVMDGAADSPAQATGFVTIEANQIVHTANIGIGLEAGHDVTAIGNRVVSCGKNPDGSWSAMPYGQAMVMWNFYGTSVYFNNRMSGTAGGLVRPSSTNTPVIADVWAPSISSSADNISGANSFTDPCLTGGVLTQTPEQAEWTLWSNKLVVSGQSIGTN